MTRLGRAIALTALVAFALATPLGGRALERACAAGDLHVAVVVDTGSSSAVSAVCVPGSSSDNGATILAARASMLGMPQPRYSTSGLLCAIDGVPSTGCGVAHDGHYAYWSYWHGDAGKWSYANVGPASGRVDPGVVEGWRWQPDGSALPTDPPPRGPADATAICAPTPPRLPAPPPTVASAPPPPVSPATRSSASGGTQPAPSTSPATGPRSSTPTAATRPRSAAPVTAGSTARGRAPARAPGESTSSSIAIAVRGIAAAPPGRAAGRVPVAFLAGVALVLAVGAGGAIAARRRRRPAS